MRGARSGAAVAILVVPPMLLWIHYELRSLPPVDRSGLTVAMFVILTVLSALLAAAVNAVVAVCGNRMRARRAADKHRLD